MPSDIPVPRQRNGKVWARIVKDLGYLAAVEGRSVIDPPGCHDDRVNAVFDWCVGFLDWLAPLLGLSYEEINVWLFVIFLPGLILALAAYCFYLRRRLRRAEARRIQAARRWP